MRRAIFLDRDGTLNKDNGYTHKIEDWQWLNGVIPALAELKKAGWLLIVISNQSGIGRGFYSKAELEKLEKFIINDLVAYGINIDAWYYCPHTPEENCPCRKPKPGLIFDAARDWNIDLTASWMIGDKWSDIQAGIAAGTHAALLAGKEAGVSIKYAYVFSDLAEAAKYILALK